MYATHFSQSNHRTTESSLGRNIFKIVFCAFVVLCALYAYIIGNITFNVVARNTFTQEKSAISSRIGELEVEYLTLSGSITMDVAKASGFEEASQVFYVKNSTGVSRSALLTNEL
jgi:hypothetical protein